MSDHLNHEFEQWLAQATRGLSADVCTRVNEELRGHYEDEVAAYIDKGETAVSAHQLALKALGDSNETRQGLRETHLAGRWYKTAVVLGFVAMLLTPVGLFTIPTEWVLVLGLTAFLPLFFAIYTLDLYLRQTYFYDKARWPIRLMMVGGVSVVLSWLFPVLFGCSLFAGHGCEGETPVLLIAYGMLYVGVASVGVCFLNLSCALKALKESGNLVLSALRVLFFVNGIALLIAVPAVLFQAFGIVVLMFFILVLMFFILVFTLMITLGALIVLFSRAARQESQFEFTV